MAADAVFSLRISKWVLPLVCLSGAVSRAWADPLDGGAGDASALDGALDAAVDARPRAEEGADASGDSVPAGAVDAPVAADGPGVVALDPVVTVTTTAPAERPRRAVDYILRARLDERAHVVSGEGTVRWTNTSRVGTRELWLHLYLNAFRSADTYFMQGWGERDRTPSQWGSIELSTLRLEDGTDLLPRASHPSVPAGDETQLRVALPREVAPGESISVQMVWRSTLPELIARTGFHGRFHMVAQWFPKVAVLEDDGRWESFPFHAHSEFYADFGGYDVTLDLPRGWPVGATGERVGPVVSTTGSRDLQRFVADRVHDFAFTTWDQFRVRDTRASSVAVRVLFAPGAESDAQRVVELADGMIPAFAWRYGPYPYPNLTVVIPPRGAEYAGGMEYPTLITTVGAWWAPRRARGLEYVTVHEFGHQYFYGLFASNESRWPFLDEGLCEYATARVMQDLYGPEGTLLDLPWLAPRFGAWALGAASSAAITAPVPVSTAAADFATAGRYGSHVYSRTETVLRSLELSVGPARFAAAMRAYAEAARFAHPTPETLFSTLGGSLEAPAAEGFLRDAIERPARLNYRVSLVESARGADGVHRGRVVLDRVGGPALPVDVVLESSAGERRFSRWDAATPTVVLPYEGSSALRAASVDLAGRVPLDENRLDNARAAEDQRRSAAPLVARIAYWVALALDVVGP